MTELLAEGKTKKIWAEEDPKCVILESKDDLTAGDGAKHDTVEDKGIISNKTTCNIFRFLNECGIPTAFIKEVDERSFLAQKCKMVPLEVVVRREAHGSYLHRFPHLEKGTYFPALVLEFFLKTTGQKWRGKSIPMDDPLLDISDDPVKLFIPHWTEKQKQEAEKTGFKGFLVGQRPFLEISRGEFFKVEELTSQCLIAIGEIAKIIFLMLEKAWQLAGKKLVDSKVEFGINTKGNLVLADVIDNESWRLMDGEKYLDKQLYRDGADLDTITDRFRLVQRLTGNFRMPHQQLILWRASEKDELEPFWRALTKYDASESCAIIKTTCSWHKQPIQGYLKIQNLIREIPDSVVIVYCGKSNGAGPTLSAQCAVPVITVPASWKNFPEDIWSSLRTASDTPVATILEPENAVLAALQILAMRNPMIYATLRYNQEQRLCNIAEI